MSVVEPGGSGDVPVIDDGLYDAVITAIKDVTLDEPDRFGNQDKVEIQVSFTDADGEPHTLEPRVNRKWGEKATLFTIAMACGLDVSPYEPFDTDDLLKRKVRVLVETPEEGKWPRVKSWSRTARGKASAPAQKPTPASSLLSLIGATGDIDWTVFWSECGKASITRQMVSDALDGNLNNLTEMEPTAVVDLFAVLKATAEGEGSVPFEN